MKKKTPHEPTINESLDRLLYIFVTEKYISDPTIFGLKSFSIQEMIQNSFDMEGDKFFAFMKRIIEY